MEKNVINSDNMLSLKLVTPIYLNNSQCCLMWDLGVVKSYEFNINVTNTMSNIMTFIVVYWIYASLFPGFFQPSEVLSGKLAPVPGSDLSGWNFAWSELLIINNL